MPLSPMKVAISFPLSKSQNRSVWSAEAETARSATLDGRTDLRGIPLVTIDGSDARDFDDAVWADG